MPRIRSVKPDFFTDEKLGSLPIQARLVFIGMWVHADDYGVVKGNAKLLKSQIFPYDDTLRIDNFSAWIDALVNARMLIPLTIRGEGYYYIRTFRDHQYVEKPSKTRYCSEEELQDAVNSLQTIPQQSGSSRGIVGEYSPPEKEKEKEKEKEGESEAHTHTHTHEKPPDAPPPKKPVEPKDIPKCFDDVAAYFAERKGNPVEAEKFYNHYSANGWRVGKNPMKDWKAAVRNWLLNTNNYGASNANNGATRSAGNGATPARGTGTINDLIAIGEKWGIKSTVTTEPNVRQAGS